MNLPTYKEIRNTKPITEAVDGVYFCPTCKQLRIHTLATAICHTCGVKNPAQERRGEVIK